VPEASFFFLSAASTIESWLSFPIKHALIPNLLIFSHFILISRIDSGMRPVHMMPIDPRTRWGYHLVFSVY